MNHAVEAYRLLDFGQGRKLEQFGPYRLDRPCPAAENERPRDVRLWQSCHARYERFGVGRGAWQRLAEMPETWAWSINGLEFELKLAPSGQIGVFPEQVQNWQWIAAQLAAAERPVKLLNLFAYTGGSTLAAARAGARVAHVDAARGVVQWARANAQRSGLAEAPIRWIADDALAFARREVKRGRRYDAVVLDPPTYGHGTGSAIWQIERDLPQLLEACGELTSGEPLLVLHSCHSPGYDAVRLEELLREVLFRGQNVHVQGRPLELRTDDGRCLPSGVAAYFSAFEVAPSPSAEGSQPRARS